MAKSLLSSSKLKVGTVLHQMWYFSLNTFKTHEYFYFVSHYIFASKILFFKDSNFLFFITLTLKISNKCNVLIFVLTYIITRLYLLTRTSLNLISNPPFLRNSQGTLFLFITLACFPFPFFQKALLPHTVRLLPPLSLHPSWWLLEDCAHDAPCVYVLRFMKELQKMMCC